MVLVGGYREDVVVEQVGFGSKDLIELLLQQILDLNELIQTQLLLGALLALLSLLKQPLLLLEILASILRIILSYNELHKVLNVHLPQCQLIDIQSDYLTHFG